MIRPAISVEIRKEMQIKGEQGLVDARRHNGQRNALVIVYREESC